ncbi:hypothetical protein [Hoyosella subflava]|uniref:Uncharacterized protein n=1 Tax=Hoyosella subflava (strain DSM 45089 / JCM 17490 / NBRC 109087 / DQS3-9A1) TaxID=443218 RepID=F6EKT4_HOYSD|nr:hypothetical protein [Hoyosella subflava]AEF41414.1 hypothetical protein AS9A_2967 [Hoyosella subflava DQS3-9A1]
MVGTVETGKDTVQHLVESAINHVGQIFVITTGMITDVIREIGDFIGETLDVLQKLIESAVSHVGQIAVLITRAIAGVIHEIGELISEGFEMIEASKAAYSDRALSSRNEYVEAEFALS